MIIDAALDLFRILRLGTSNPRANAWSNLEVFWIALIHSRPIDISCHLLFIRAIGPDYSCTGTRRLGLSRSQMLLSCARRQTTYTLGRADNATSVIVRTVLASTAHTRLLRHS